jgi:gluconolactonase
MMMPIVKGRVMTNPHADAWNHDRTIVRFPDMAVEVVDQRFHDLIIWQEVVERLWTGGRWTEGPVWFGDGRYVLFSDIPNNRMMRWDEVTGRVHPFRVPANNSNGNTRDRLGRLITCEHLTRRVTRTEHDGSITVLMDAYAGKRLNAPNDVVVDADNAVWFTDPGWGITNDYEGDAASPELPQHVYRIDPTNGFGAVAIEGIERPNGLCFSPKADLLYVVSRTNMLVYTMVAGRAVNGREFALLPRGNYDGMRCDMYGNIWAATGNGGAGIDGVHCYAPDGTLLGRIHLPEVCANVCFGGIKRNRLFMTASRSLYSVYLNTRGA